LLLSFKIEEIFYQKIWLQILQTLTLAKFYIHPLNLIKNKMKKIYTLTAAFAVILSVNAQNRALNQSNGANASNRTVQVNPTPATRAMGDTLMWLPSPGVYLFDAADQASFEVVTEDEDALPPYNAGAPMDYALYYSINTDVNGMGNPTGDNFYHPWEDQSTDSSFFWSATSWFNPAGQAKNWLMMGPVTLPSTACSLKWYDRTNPAYRDGYKVILSTTVSSPMTYPDFTDPAIYTKTDAYPSPTYTTDTTWVLRSVNIPASYLGQQIYIAYFHNANDMDVLYLDEMTVEKATSVGVTEFANGVKVAQNSPNPCSTVSTISYELENNAAVALSVFDVTGKKIAEQNEGNQSAGVHTLKFNAENLAAGVYYYSLTVGENSTSVMKMVVVK
jgi:hypothetical protein